MIAEASDGIDGFETIYDGNGLILLQKNDPLSGIYRDIRCFGLPRGFFFLASTTFTRNPVDLCLADRRGLCSMIFFCFAGRCSLSNSRSFNTRRGVVLRGRPGPSHSGSLLTLPPLCLLFAAIVGFVAAGLIFIVHADPHGDWDAFAIWNSHARYLYRDGPAWQTHMRNTFHADYPLLVPSMNARVWRYASQEIPETGGWLGLLYTLSALGVLIATLAELRGVRLAMIIGSVLLGTPFFLEFGVLQSADVPLSLYFLSAFALSSHSNAEGSLVCWSFPALWPAAQVGRKNEGLLFIVALHFDSGSGLR